MELSGRFLLPLMTSIMFVARTATMTVNSYCSEEPPVPGEPTKPNMNYSYTTEIVGKRIDLGGVVYMYEYFDSEENKLAYDSLWQGFKYSEIYDFERGSLIFSIQDRCTFLQNYEAVKNYSDDGMRSLEILLNLRGNWKYVGEKIIRGVEVLQWRSCGRWSYWANFTADYYFIKNNQNPLRLEMIGVKTVSESGKTSEFHRIYDYFLFQRGKPPSANVFKPPPGELCAGQMEMTPQLPTYASYRVEEINPIDKIVINSRVVFDKQKRLFKEENSKTIIVRDFKRGYQFEINKETKECTRKMFYGFGSSLQIADKQGVIHIAQLKHFFMGDWHFTYNGVHRARRVSCDVYTGKAQAAEELGTAVVELYTARAPVRPSNEDGNVTSTIRTPVQIVLKGGLDKHHMETKRQYEIYDFEVVDLSAFNPFDLSSCFNVRETVEFSITYEGNVVNAWKWIKDKIVKKVSDLISEYLGISPLRVSLTDAIPGNGEVKVIGSLFDAENETILFETIANTRNTINDTEHVYTHPSSRNTPTICSGYCFDETQRPGNASSGYCWAFEFDRQSQKCTLFFNQSFDFAFSDHIDFYQRKPADQLNHISVSKAWELLEDGVRAGLLNFTDSVGNVFKPITVTRRDKSGGYTESQEVSDRPIDKYRQISGIIKTKPVEEITHIYRDACARYCTNTSKYNCEAFMYDKNEMMCFLFNSSSYRDRYSPIKATQFTYVRNYYYSFDKIFGRSILSPRTDFVYSGVQDMKTCALLCVKEKQFFCQSFEMCGEDVCLLGQNHFYDTPSTQVKENISCIYYTRNYIQDYYIKTKTGKDLHRFIVSEIPDITIKKCATLCSTSHNYDCDTFEFCKSNSICLLATKSTKNENTNVDSVSQNVSTCDLFYRKPGRSRFINIDKSKIVSNDSKGDGHSLESMCCVAVGMFFLGIGISIFGAIFVFKLRPSSRVMDIKTTTVTFSKEKEKVTAAENPSIVITQDGEIKERL